MSVLGLTGTIIRSDKGWGTPMSDGSSFQILLSPGGTTYCFISEKVIRRPWQAKACLETVLQKQSCCLTNKEKPGRSKRCQRWIPGGCSSSIFKAMLRSKRTSQEKSSWFAEDEIISYPRQLQCSGSARAWSKNRLGPCCIHKWEVAFFPSLPWEEEGCKARTCQGKGGNVQGG